MLSILAIVVGFAVPALDVSGRLRTAVTGMFVAGQWGVPLTPWLAEGAGLEFVHPLAFLWGGLLVVSMLVLAWQAAVGPESTGGEPRGPTPADD